VSRVYFFPTVLYKKRNNFNNTEIKLHEKYSAYLREIQALPYYSCANKALMKLI
jgi:hypothetical protein